MTPLAPDAGDGLADRPHVASAEVELAGAQDGLVAELQHGESRLVVGGGPGFAGTHHGGGPAVLRGQLLPRFDRVRPGLGVADRIAAGQADADFDAVGDRRLAAGREDDGLVAAGGEVAEGVVGAELQDEPAQRRFVVAGEGVVGALGAEQRDDGGQQGDGAEQTEERVDEAVRVSVELFVVDRRRGRSRG